MFSPENPSVEATVITDDVAYQWLKQYFATIRTLPELSLEVALLERLNLAAFLKELAKTPGFALNIITQLCESGQFPAEVVVQLQERALINQQRKNKRANVIKKGFRLVRTSTKIIAAAVSILTLE